MIVKYTVVALSILISSLSYATTNTQEKSNPPVHVQNSPQTIQNSNNAPFLRQGETVIIVGDNAKHNYVDDMSQMEKESLFQRHATLFVGGFLLLSIIICCLIYFYVSRKHKNEEGATHDLN